jgi:hypothetical protein
MKLATQRSRGKLLLVLLVACGPAFADAPEPQFTLIGDVSETYHATAVDWQSSPGMAWQFATDLKPKFTYGPVVFVADTTWQVPMTASLSLTSPLATVYEAYFRVTAAPGLDLTFGQKHYNLGVGQLFTVGDSINPVTGFFDQKTGFRGVTAEWSLGSATSVSAALSTENSDLTGAGQLSLLLDKLQLTGSLVADGTEARTFNPALGASYDLSGIILTAEGAAELLPQGVVPTTSSPATWAAPAAWSDPALSGSAGARYTFTIGDFDYTVALQYLHWGQGWTTAETNAWNADLSSGTPVLQGQAAQVRPVSSVRSQENGFLQLSAVSGTTWNFSGLGVMDLQDHSVIGQVQAAWDPWDNVEFGLMFLFAEGDSGTSYQYLPQDALLGLTAPQSRYQISFSTTYHF